MTPKINAPKANMAQTVWIIVGVIVGVIVAISVLVAGILLTRRKTKADFLKKGRLTSTQLPSSHEVQVLSRPSLDRPDFTRYTIGTPESIASTRQSEAFTQHLLDKAVRKAASDPKYRDDPEYRKLFEQELHSGRFRNVSDIYKPRLNLESAAQSVKGLLSGIVPSRARLVSG